MADAHVPTIAVCIPTYNQAQFLARAVASARRQVGFPDVDVWVSDDASTDDTPGVMAALCREDQRVHYHRHERNLGIAENASWVLAQPSTEFVVRLDSDDVLLPEYMSTLAGRLVAQPEAGYAHSAVAVIDDGDRPQSVARLFRPREYVDADVALRESLQGYKTVANILMFRAEALRQANYFRGRPDFAEDYDLSIRLADLGYGNIYVDEVLAQYRVWTDAGGGRNHRKAEHLRGLTAIFDNSLMVAFRRRGWNVAAVRSARRRAALRFAPSIFVPWFTEEERASLLPLLFRLDGGVRVRLRVQFLKLGLGPVYAAAARVDAQSRKFAKRVLARLRSPRQSGASG